MGWRFPERIQKDGGVIDHEDFIDMVRPVVEELSGRLDEHNFSADMASELVEENLAADVPYAFKHTYLEHPDGIWDLRDAFDSTANQAQIDGLRFSGRWQRVGSALTLTLEEARTIRVIGSVQYWWGPNNIAVGARKPAHLTVAWANVSEARWALRLASAVYAECVAGSQDWAEEGHFMEKGYRGIFNAPHLETLITLPPGVHTIELVVQVLSDNDPTRASATKFINYSNFELLALEMRA